MLTLLEIDDNVAAEPSRASSIERKVKDLTETVNKRRAAGGVDVPDSDVIRSIEDLKVDVLDESKKWKTESEG